MFIETVFYNPKMYIKTHLQYLVKALKQYVHFFATFYFAVLDVKAFERLMGPCMDVMKRNINEYEEQLAAIFGHQVNIADLR